ncbi:MAG: hypothetical protein GY756_11855, partial [bacterium]|nr:hypothetical protein [bacterium]
MFTEPKNDIDAEHYCSKGNFRDTSLNFWHCDTMHNLENCAASRYQATKEYYACWSAFSEVAVSWSASAFVFSG